MKSFDFFDTLFTRIVAKPTDIFDIVERQLKLPGYSAARAEAETFARLSLGGEVGWNDIAGELIRRSPVFESGLNLELDLEGCLLVPIVENFAELSDEDLIVTDMYLPSQFYAGIMMRHGFKINPANLFISGEKGCNKASGGLWRLIKSERGSPALHIGDNFQSDCKQAKKLGIEVRHYKGAQLNWYEKNLMSIGLAGSLLAGCSRAVRLSKHPQSVERQAFSSVFGPLLYLFCNWVIDNCISERIEKIFFLARDGQILHQICSSLVVARGLNLECRYVYGSRQALHLPGYQNIDSAESWILENAPVLTLGDISRRTLVDLQLILALAAESDLHFDAEENITYAQRIKLKKLIRKPRFLDALVSSSEKALRGASSYYSYEGFASNHKVALVDVGWNARMQASLRNIVNKAQLQVESISGFYLCLSQNHIAWSNDRAKGYLYSATEPQGGCVYDRYRAVFEAALSAAHGTTLGFTDTTPAQPIFGNQPSDKNRARIAAQQACIMTFIEFAERVPGAAQLSPDAESTVKKNLNAFLTTPSSTDALAFEGFELFDGQTEDRPKQICQKLPVWRLIADGQNLGFWTEGTLALSGVKGVNYVGRMLGRLKNLLRRG